MQCDKVRYSSQTDAKIALDGINNDAGKRRNKNIVHRVYECEDCQGWHLTSRSKKRKLYERSPKSEEKSFEYIIKNIDSITKEARKRSKLVDNKILQIQPAGFKIK
jgi:hypothetical protein